MNLFHMHTILQEISEERLRQDTKWGEQNHQDFSEHLAGQEIICGDADKAKYLCDSAFKNGYGSYSHILLEEFHEALEQASFGDKEKLREELIQTAAVAVAWIEKLDRELLALTVG